MYKRQAEQMALLVLAIVLTVGLCIMGYYVLLVASGQ